jgi:uncharacterized protein
MTSIPVLAGAGAVIGLLYGLFGVGSAFATPLLALLGVPALAAVASPLPSLLPGSAAGATTYARSGLVDRRVAARTLRGAVPACILGALASHWLGGPWLLALSGAVLVGVGIRVVVPMSPAIQEPGEPAPTGDAPVDPAGAGPIAVASPVVARRERLALVCGLGALVGFAAGLLSNGGGFLLVPLFLLALGLTLPEATATSLVVATVLTVPTVVTHALMGDIDWAVAIPFTFGLVPAAVLGARCAPRLPVVRLQATFGVLLVVVGGWFLYRQARVLGLG